jgi:hypothetical protein
MSITKCKGCGVLTETDACRRCGYKMRMGWVRKLLFGLVVLGFAGLMMYYVLSLAPHTVP